MNTTLDEISQLSEVIGLIYEGATDPTRWTRDILPAVAEYFGAPSCALFTPMQAPHDGGFGFIHGLSQKQMELYFTRFQADSITGIPSNPVSR